MSEPTNQSAEQKGPIAQTAATMDILWAALLMAVLAAVGVTFLMDPQPKFRFEEIKPPAEKTAATPAPSTTPAASSNIEAAPIVGAEAPVVAPDPSNLQALFLDAQSLRGQNKIDPPFVTDVDFGTPRAYQPLREAEVGRIYSAMPKKNPRALNRVAKLGGYASADAMAQSFGYGSVDQMVASWDQTIQVGPQFQPEYFGTNAQGILPTDD